MDGRHDEMSVCSRDATLSCRAQDCHAEQHADYDGAAVSWGLDFKTVSAAACCRACKAVSMLRAAGARGSQRRSCVHGEWIARRGVGLQRTGKTVVWARPRRGSSWL